MNEDIKLSWLIIGIIFFFLSLTALTECDYIYGIGMLFISGIFFSKI